MARSRKSTKCPQCGSRDVLLQDSFEGINLYVCADCDYEFETGGGFKRTPVEDLEDDDEDIDARLTESEWEE